MKRTIILSLAVSAVILTACGQEAQNVETEQLSITDPAMEQTEADMSDPDPEQTSESTASYTQEEPSDTTVSVSESSIEDTTPEITTGSTSSEIKMEAVSANPDTLSAGQMYRLIDVSLPQDNFFVRDSLICAPQYNSNGVDYSGQADLNFIDVNTNEVVGTVSLPSGFRLHEVYPMSGNILVKIINKGYDFETSSEVISVAVIYDDFRLEIIDNASVNDVWFENYGHKVSQWGLDIVSVDDDPEIIVPGNVDGYGFSTAPQKYMLPIDKNHFVYRTVGEFVSGLGIYNYSTKTASDIPDSKDYIPVGVHNGKIYVVTDSYYGGGTALYTIDINRFEIKYFMDFPYELEQNANVYYYMSPDGDNVVILKAGNKKDVTPAIYIADPDTAVIRYTYEFPDGYDIYNSLFFIDENHFATGVRIDKEAKLIVFTIPD